MELSEDELIAAIARVVVADDPGIRVGIGDDAAVVASGAGELVLATDLLVEGVHFGRDSISAHDLGAKAVAVNVSDLAAMAASPRFALVALALPADAEAAWVMELYGGMHDACVEYALALVGGDTSRGGAVTISVAVVGEVSPGRAVTRSGARPGDEIVVTGSLGAAAGGLALSRLPAPRTAAALSEPWGRELARALARPVARVGEAQRLAQAGATAMMDLSDGLAKDLSRMCAASGVGARVATSSIPVSEDLVAGAEVLGVEPLHLALSGGEDYELLATLGAADVDGARAELSERFGVRLTVVGSMTAAPDVVSVGADGIEAPLEARGWDHFDGA